LTWIKQLSAEMVHQTSMRSLNDNGRVRRRQKPATAAGPAGIACERNHALGMARDLAASGLRLTLCWQTARTLFRLGFTAALALFAGRLIEDGTFDMAALAGALAGLLCAGGAGLLADLTAASAEDRVVNKLRTSLADALLRKSPARIRDKQAGALVAGLQRYPNAVASLVVGLGAAKSMLLIGPLLAASAVALLTWQAALMLLLAIPVMVVVFVLLGGVIRGKAEAQEKAFGRLAAQFSDRIRTLPTILANHALLREHGKIEQRMTVHADSTMAVLKVAFLNAGVIDFFSAIAIAVLAVLLGLGHLGLLHLSGFSGLKLWQSLFVLMIAAEFFTPFRRYAEQYHVKAEGEAAAAELDWYFDEADAASSRGDQAQARPFEIVGAFDAADLPPFGLIAISGPSGAGKSTLLRWLAGIEVPPEGFKPLPPIMAERCAWISTDIYVPAGTLTDAIGWHCGTPDPTELRAAASRVGLIDERLLPGGLAARIAEGGENLSGGQRMRIGIARMMLSSGVVLADEPTAKLDSNTARLVRQVLIETATRRLVIVATHDPQLIEAASRHCVLQAPSPNRQAVAA
jgi:ATP-binding cassette subfamily C protein